MPDDQKTLDEKGNGIGKIIFKLLLYVVLIAAGAGGTYYIAKTKPSLIGLPKSPQEAQAEDAAIVAQVGKLITLPTGETPTIATVTNIDQLKDQPFFKNAKNGDKILIYQKANRAIIYRPSENKVVDVGSINTTVPTPAQSPSPKDQVR